MIILTVLHKKGGKKLKRGDQREKGKEFVPGAVISDDFNILECKLLYKISRA
jgi:hypothetical protein